MATSGSIDFTVKGSQIVEDALIEVGAYDTDETVKQKDLELCLRRLNIMVKSWNNRPHMHLRKDVTITLTPGTQSYTWGSGGVITDDRPTRIVTARRVDSAGTNEVPIDVVARSEYKDLPTKATEGPPNLIHYDPQLELGVLFVWPTGDTGTPTIICETQRQVEDFDAKTDNPDFPKEAYLALYLNLAVNIARAFGRTASQTLVMDAKSAYNEWLEHDEDQTSFFIIPSNRR